jgi:hypothetical protein
MLPPTHAPIPTFDLFFFGGGGECYVLCLYVYVHH